jgi:hypothetical protein
MMNKQSRPARTLLPNQQLQEVAARAQSNPDTVRQYLRGLLVRQSTIDRISLALEQFNLGHLVRQQDAAPPPSTMEHQP